MPPKPDPKKVKEDPNVPTPKPGTAPRIPQTTIPLELLPAPLFPLFNPAETHEENFQGEEKWEDPDGNPPLPPILQKSLAAWARPTEIFSKSPYEGCSSFQVKLFEASEDESSLDTLDRRRDLTFESFDPTAISSTVPVGEGDPFGPWHWLIATFLHISHHLSIASIPALELLRNPRERGVPPAPAGGSTPEATPRGPEQSAPKATAPTPSKPAKAPTPTPGSAPSPQPMANSPLGPHEIAAIEGLPPCLWELISPQGPDGRPALSPTGRYLVRLRLSGSGEDPAAPAGPGPEVAAARGWRQVAVDDRLPVGCDGRLLFPLCRSARSRTVEIWPALLCKALCKVAAAADDILGTDALGGLCAVPESISAGSAAPCPAPSALSWLLGTLPETMRLDPANPSAWPLLLSLLYPRHTPPAHPQRPGCLEPAHRSALLPAERQPRFRTPGSRSPYQLVEEARARGQPPPPDSARSSLAATPSPAPSLAPSVAAGGKAAGKAGDKAPKGAEEAGAQPPIQARVHQGPGAPSALLRRLQKAGTLFEVCAIPSEEALQLGLRPDHPHIVLDAAMLGDRPMVRLYSPWSRWCGPFGCTDRAAWTAEAESALGTTFFQLSHPAPGATVRLTVPPPAPATRGRASRSGVRTPVERPAPAPAPPAQGMCDFWMPFEDFLRHFRSLSPPPARPAPPRPTVWQLHHLEEEWAQWAEFPDWWENPRAPRAPREWPILAPRRSPVTGLCGAQVVAELRCVRADGLGLHVTTIHGPGPDARRVHHHGPLLLTDPAMMPHARVSLGLPLPHPPPDEAPDLGCCGAEGILYGRTAPWPSTPPSVARSCGYWLVVDITPPASYAPAAGAGPLGWTVRLLSDVPLPAPGSGDEPARGTADLEGPVPNGAFFPEVVAPPARPPTADPGAAPCVAAEAAEERPSAGVVLFRTALRVRAAQAGAAGKGAPAAPADCGPFTVAQFHMQVAAGGAAGTHQTPAQHLLTKLAPQVRLRVWDRYGDPAATANPFLGAAIQAAQAAAATPAPAAKAPAKGTAGKGGSKGPGAGEALEPDEAAATALLLAGGRTLHPAQLATGAGYGALALPAVRLAVSQTGADRDVRASHAPASPALTPLTTPAPHNSARLPLAHTPMPRMPHQYRYLLEGTLEMPPPALLGSELAHLRASLAACLRATLSEPTSAAAGGASSRAPTPLTDAPPPSAKAAP
ncbi:hypothetical protein PAPYR_2331 [Paratrimastix pyriformis]|uniref:Calpain catalytic domain-containing protein n=1 Tax=Paratrimastix pyriformis TaxID=342808 RepID=A0ABQ8UQ48_9EUKA|nr:hypothetical protein PAPYR_2331 [Paratrimastix pyriformis]